MPRKSKKAKAPSQATSQQGLTSYPPIGDDDGFDIADDLLAALDEREADEAAQAEDQRRPKSQGLREAGGRIVNGFLHSHSSPTSRYAGLPAYDPSKAADAEAPDSTAASPSHHGRRDSLRRLFGGGGSKSPETQHASLSSSSSVAESKGKKVNRQQLRKEKKAAEIESIRRQAQEEVNAQGSGPDPAEQERQGMLAMCAALGVTLHEITPDGHCLYAAVADQLNLHGKCAQPVDFRAARKATAQEMRNHPDEFKPFISDSDEHMAGIENKEAGTLDSEDAQQRYFLNYCDAVERTGVWGGQPEILALSRAFKTQVNVVQAGMPVLKVGEGEYPGEALLISYHRKMYGLGEHYNSLRPKIE